ncbi:MAG: phosphonopyruvate decarboxylase, partial [Clostridiales bacterium]|nr:phosphonopyruvate decarboxylase [Clostridiales bacterium]
PVVYLQNSGEGNIVNPVASLLNERVYGVPCVFVVGWRGEPNVHDEPQHIFQGMITLQLLKDLEITPFVVEKDGSKEEFNAFCTLAEKLTREGKSVAFVIKKGALESEAKADFQNNYTMTREEVIRRIVAACGDDVVISTTGKASRELFEIR